MKCLFRADASQLIGAGHVMRCMALADELAKRGANVHFVCREFHGHLAEQLTAQGHKVHLLRPKSEDTQSTQHASWLGADQTTDVQETLEIIVSIGTPDWVIADHYGIDAVWHGLVRQRARRLLVIDDLADRDYECDLLVDVTLNRKKKEYQGRVPEETRLLLGPAYSLLRPQFIENRKLALEKRTQFQGVNRILVSMGGSDPLNATGFVLQALNRTRQGLKVDVVLGKHAPHISEVKKLIQKRGNNVVVHHDVRNMAELMLSADVAIGTPSTTALERCCLGLPSIVITTEVNQYDTAKSLHKSGAVKSVGRLDELAPETLVDSLFALVTNKDDWFAMSHQAASLCDGQGVSRTVKAMMYEY